MEHFAGEEEGSCFVVATSKKGKEERL